MINRTWSTKRLRIADSQIEDLPQLERVLISNSDTLRLNGIQKPDPRELQRWLTDGDIPPGGRRENYRLQTISRMDNDEAVGYLSVYHGYPDSGTIYISSFFIRQDCQGIGFGSEVVDQMPILDGLVSYSTHRLVVTIRNWNAVQFWVRCGFTNIVQVLGNITAKSDCPAKLELTRNCREKVCCNQQL